MGRANRSITVWLILSPDFPDTVWETEAMAEDLYGGRGFDARGTREVGPDKGNVRIMSGFPDGQEREAIWKPLVFRELPRNLAAPKASPLSANVRILSAFLTGYGRWLGIVSLSR